jgi:hypothetical protein
VKRTACSWLSICCVCPETLSGVQLKESPNFRIHVALLLFYLVSSPLRLPKILQASSPIYLSHF